MSELGKKEELIKESLYNFIQKHGGDLSRSAIDDIVIRYVVGFLEELGSQENSEDDMNDFIEMMSPFLPQLVDINSALICKWIFELAESLSALQDKDDSSNVQEIESIEHCVNVNMERKHLESSNEKLDNGNSVMAESTLNIYNDELQLLHEMFPTACTLELQHCLCIANGNTEKAAQLILHRQESGENITVTLPRQAPKAVNKQEQNDTELRQHILSRYMYVDQSEDKKEHKPVAPKWEPKKLIRYRNNQIVSIKGEKYTEVKETESEEMKKTYVTLKPARQYRFH